MAQEIACKAQEISLQGARKKSGLAGKAKNRCDRAKNSCDKASCQENGGPLPGKWGSLAEKRGLPCRKISVTEGEIKCD